MKCHSLILAAGLLLATQTALAKTESLRSPDGRIEARLDSGEQLTLAILHDGKEILAASPLSMRFGDGSLVGNAAVRKVRRRTVDTEIRPVVARKRAVERDRYNELRAFLSRKDGVILRAYDDGVALRFFTERQGALRVVAERVELRLPGDWPIWRTRVPDFFSSCESRYDVSPLSGWKEGALAFLPVLIDVPEGPKMAVTEADLDDYPGLWLTHEKAAAADAMVGRLPAYPLEVEMANDRSQKVVKRGDYLADTQGPRSFPWRVFVIAEKDGILIESDIVYRLAPPPALEDTSWIRPGKVAWDWWNANNIYDVGFEAGVNTETYEHYIDFAAENGIEYVILDEGWSDTKDLLARKPEIDLPALIAHGQEKGVGLILWCVWATLERQMEPALAAFEEWGIKGVKVDFMDRDDQVMVRFYRRLAEATAHHHLLLDFHGAYKPTGLRRAYPNLITREGVQGLEYDKWSNLSDPEYTVTIPFIRMLAGPMDYTPGAMNNAQKDSFRPIFTRPMSLGTRAHQVAEYVVFESPLQMLADSPTAYRKNPDCLRLISRMPTTWDETRVLAAQVGDYVLLARRKGRDWYVGAMTDWTSRELELDLSFLPEGDFEAEIVADGLNAHRIAIDHRHEKKVVTRGDRLPLRLAPGGGFAAILEARP